MSPRDSKESQDQSKSISEFFHKNASLHNGIGSILDYVKRPTYPSPDPTSFILMRD